MRGLFFICNTPCAARAFSVLQRRVESAVASCPYRTLIKVTQKL